MYIDGPPPTHNTHPTPPPHAAVTLIVFVLSAAEPVGLENERGAELHLTACLVQPRAAAGKPHGPAVGELGPHCR